MTDSKTIGVSVTQDDIEQAIASEYYFTAADGVTNSGNCLVERVPNPLNLLTFCVLVLRNGFTVIGESACVDPLIFNAEKGRMNARIKAINKVRTLMECLVELGYELKSKLAQA